MTEEPTQKSPPICEKCKGSRHLLRVKKDFLGYDSEYYEPCTCLIGEKYLQKLGSKIFNQRNLKKSKLINQVNSNLFIHGLEKKFLPHLKYILIRQGLNFSFSIMDDSHYLRIYLGDDPEIKDISSWQKDFFVFFMGHVGYKNKALPGMICELLNVRLLHNQITWIHYPDRFWGPGCIEFSDDLKSLIDNHFTFVDMRSPLTKSDQKTVNGGSKMNDQLVEGFNKT